MGFGKNNVLHSNHFRKDWQRHVKTWFNQPGRKLRRRNARKAKAATLGVRPLTLLRPAVRGQTVRYNAKIREGRGFTLGELKEAGISRKSALGQGIVVDHRRRNLSVEGKAINVERLKAYKERLVVFPRKAGKPKKGDSSVRFLPIFPGRELMTISSARRPQSSYHSSTPFSSPSLCSRTAPQDYPRGAGLQCLQDASQLPGRGKIRRCAQNSCGKG